MFKRFIIVSIFCWGCASSNKSSIATRFEKGFHFMNVSESFKLTLTEFHKNDVYPYSEGGAPYALLIGQPSNAKLPKTISVLAIRDNNRYHVGQTVTVFPNKELREDVKSGLLYVIKDTVINTVKGTWIIGSENPAVLAKVSK